MVKDKPTAELSRIKQELQALEAELERLTIAADKDSYEHVCGVPCIGKKTAIVLIAVTQGMRGFDNARQVSSYFGLCPRVCCSGRSICGKCHICKMGMSQVSKLLYMCALSAKRTNKAYIDLYERLLQAGKSKKLALIAVANKLLKRVYAIIKNNVPYDNNFFAKKIAF
jgi:transposase